MNLQKQKKDYTAEKDEELSKLKFQIEEIEQNKTKKMKELETESKKDQDAMKKNFDEKVMKDIETNSMAYRNLNFLSN